MQGQNRTLLIAGAVIALLIVIAAGYFLFAGGGEGAATTPAGGEGAQPAQEAGQTQTQTQAQQEQAAEGERKVRVLVIFDVGGPGDLSFNDMAILGAERAKEDFGVEVDYQTPKSQSEMPSLLEAVSRSGKYDLIVLVGFLWTEAVEQVAPKFPEQKYALIDSATREPMDNVACFVFREQEVASLVGIVAADIAKNIMERTGEEAKAGAVAGMDIPPLWRFHIGYLYGVQYYNKATGSNIDMVWIYTGKFDDPALGKQTTEQMLQQGVRVFYGVAGLTHVGMFDAVREAAARGIIAFSIGQDASQEWYDPNTIIVSGMKRVDVAVYKAIEMVVKGEWKGGVTSLGIKEGGLGLSDEEIIRYFAEIAAKQGRLPEGMTPDDVVRIVMEKRKEWISDTAWQLVEELKQKIISGEIKFVTPKDHDEYDRIIEELKKGNLDAAIAKG